MIDQRANQVAARFFIRVGQVGRATETRDPFTQQLFPLPVIMDAEGLLASDAKHLARSTDPETSHEAAEKAASFAGKHEAACFGAIHDAGAFGATAKEIARATGLTDVQVNRRLGNMGERGLIRRNGDKREGCAVWLKA